VASLVRLFGYIYDATGVVVSAGHLTLTLQQDIVSVDGTKVAPSTIVVDLAATAGYVEVFVYATVGATPAGISYLVEYDPDPADTTLPIASKDGYWRNYWAVPNTASVTIGSFVTALRGAPVANYMPLGGTLPFSSTADEITIGATPSDTDKRIIANQGVGPNPTIRYNHVLGLWEVSDDGTVFYPVGLVAHRDEVPAGAMNGSNTVYTTSAAYIAGQLSVYLNGLRQRAAGNDYSETTSTTFTMVQPPHAGDVLTVDFVG
jgi:hypothetical protein